MKQLIINNQIIFLYVADTLEKQIFGLKHKAFLEPNHGMLFVFEREDFYSMCMNDTFIPLSVAFINKDFEVTNIEDMEPLSKKQYYSNEKVRYAIEMNKGWFNQNNVFSKTKIIL